MKGDVGVKDKDWYIEDLKHRYKFLKILALYGILMLMFLVTIFMFGSEVSFYIVILVGVLLVVTYYKWHPYRGNYKNIDQEKYMTFLITSSKEEIIRLGNI